MSLYTPIDDGLNRWAQENGFEIACEYRKIEVRMFFWATQGGTVQFWVEPKHDGIFEVVACNNRLGSAKRLDRVEVVGTDIGSALDDLIALVKCWEKW
jgi:hypothetical protein